MGKRVRTILLVLLFVLLYHVYRGITAHEYLFYEATRVSVEDMVSVSGYIAKDEMVINAGLDGVISAYYQEGERVSTGSRVCEIIKGDPDPALMAQLQNVNRRIEEIEKSQQQKAAFIDDAARLTQEFDRKVNEYVHYSRDKRLLEMVAVKNDMNKLLAKRSLIQEGGEGYKQLLSGLKDEKRQLEDRFSASKLECVTNRAGVYSENIDGYEGILTNDYAARMTVSDYNNLGNVKYNRSDRVEVGQPAVKIIDNFSWHFVTLLTDKQSEKLKQGEYITLRFPQLASDQVRGRVTYISESKDGMRVASFACDRYLNGILSQRKVHGDVIFSKYEGLKIPESAIKVINGKPGVYVKKNDSLQFIETNILFKTSEFSVVEDLSSDLSKKDTVLALHDIVALNYR